MWLLLKCTHGHIFVILHAFHPEFDAEIIVVK